MIKQIPSNEIENYTKNNTNLVLLDVRTEEEWNADGKPDGDKIGLNPKESQKFKDHKHFLAAVNFCEKWDQTSFDPNYNTLPLDYFKPMIAEVFSREPWTFN